MDCAALLPEEEDIPLLIEKFLIRKEGRQTNIIGITPKVSNLYIKYDRPGNVLQSKNAIEYATVMCSNEWIQPENLPNFLSKTKFKKEKSIKLNYKVS